ncbi:amino acid ABC transporter substrate-binding protein [Pseudomonas tohonis]|uniref:Amino acid ABC transporter substrate-binding protein n=1 Tax=Pseudomonas tohonis TaxID=2725477 RepID=A0A6J4E5D1_9PSED|nr:transporter substrate-binding domain-containing protein [Pseudomonas tohonis]BCG24184.1 amino acid ABC transporter substrate-binding protein [Pseudomonas tohonis]GJN55719.1 amino acid ABC transporter substrate-binding protein [Pseudomonas tohonis]
MRAFLLVALLCATALCRAQAQTPIEVTILCDSGYPPYSYEEKGEAKGLYTDILRSVFALMPGYKVTIRPVPWPRGLAEVAKGSAFALYPPYYRPDERPWMEYSQPIMEESLAVFIRPGLAGTRHFDDFPSAYAGLRVGLNSGFVTVNSQRYREMVEAGEIDQSYARDNRTNLLKLLHQRIDVYINDRLSILWELQQMREDGSISPEDAESLVEGPVLATERGHLGFTRLNAAAYPYRADFMQRFDTALAKVQANGTLDRLAERYAAPEFLPATASGTEKVTTP